MQAVILAGGKATRLQPLTATVPKPVIPLVDRPFMAYMLDWLGDHGVDDVIMSCGFLAAGVRDALGDGSRFGVRIRHMEEPAARGTAGAVKYAESLLDERFLVLNGDVLTDIDLHGQMALHEDRDAKLTLALVPVPDASSYGLVALDADGAVQSFSEKSEQTGLERPLISAGAYVIERQVIAEIPVDVEVSIERDVFPRWVGRGLYGHVAEGYWLDIGTPDRYLDAVSDILAGRVRTRRPVDSAHPSWVAGTLIDPVLIGPDCVVDAGAVVGPNVVLGAGTHVCGGARIERSVLLEGCTVRDGARVESCIVAAGARIGRAARLAPGVIVGPGALIDPGTVLESGTRVWAQCHEAADGPLAPAEAVTA